MKTTIEISDALLQRAKQLALKRRLTLRRVIEAALREFLDSKAGGAGKGRFRLRKHTFRGRGLQPGLDEADWAEVRRRAYEGRGG